MKKNFKHLSPLTMALNNFIIDLPSPTSLTYSWNWGSMMGMVFIIQIVTGIFLASHYISSIEMAFDSIIHIMRDVKSGWLMRFIHMNGASMFFVLIYLHITRGITFSSFKLTHTWLSGLSIIFILFGTGFLGYVLPWGQMSFWGATVITNLVSAIPYLGQTLVEWLWGGFSINQATLSRFFTLHFLMPFILIGFVILHLMSLHQTGSNSPTGMNSNLDKISFHPYFTIKDSISIILFIMIFIFFSLLFPFSMGDPENFNMANPLNTPIHIQPEWYFLFAYAILRSIPNKLGGVLALVFSILIISILTFTKTLMKTKKFSPFNKITLWFLINNFMILTWIGANPVEQPFEMIGKIFSVLYFMLMLFMCFFQLSWKQY